MSMVSRMTGRRPILRYSGTHIRDENPKARLGYDMSVEASVGVTPNATARSWMYGEMPVRAAFPMKEYKEQMTKMMVFFQFGHCIALSTPTQFFFIFFFLNFNKKNKKKSQTVKEMI